MIEGQRHTCPRRMSSFGSWKHEEDLDTWRASGGIIGQEEIGLGCSFCGSLDPDRFMELVREGWACGPTDKNYKVYLGRPRTDAEIAARKIEWLQRAGSLASTVRKLAREDGRDDEETGAALDEAWERHELPFVRESSQEAKFYWYHLSDAQKQEFIDLLNQQQVKIGYPGHFYTRPYFIAWEPREQRGEDPPGG